MLGDEHIVEHRLGLPQTDVLKGPGHARPGDLIRGRGESLRVKSIALALVLLFHFALGVVFDDLRPVEPHRAVGGLVHAGDDIEGGGLSRAVGSDEGHDLPLVDLQLQIVHSHNAAELHGDVIQSQKLLTHGCTASFFALFCRFFRRSGSSLSPMMPFRKNSTTTMMMTENTTIRKPVRRKGTLKLPM